MNDDSWKDQALRHIIRSYGSAGVRLYNRLRLLSFRRRMLDEVAQYLPESGNVLDLGCGYGLFSIYFAMALPGIRMQGIDVSSQRIAMAREAVGRLAVQGVEFEAGDVCGLRPSGAIQGAVMIDLVHHLPRAAVEGLVETVAGAMVAGSRLIIKDIDPSPWPKMAYTWVLDKLVAPRSPVNYWTSAELRKLLGRFGLCTYQHRMADFLPCPHVMYIATKRG